MYHWTKKTSDEKPAKTISITKKRRTTHTVASFAGSDVMINQKPFVTKAKHTHQSS